MQSAERAGKLIIMHTSLPSYEAPGKLKMRDDRKLLGTDKEKVSFGCYIRPHSAQILLNEQTDFYSKLAEKCVQSGCCVDLFLFPNAYTDIATIGQVCVITGGQMWKYQYFDVSCDLFAAHACLQPERDGARFVADLAHNLSRATVFDAMMRVRTSTGLRPVHFFGNIFMQVRPPSCVLFLSKLLLRTQPTLNLLPSTKTSA
jgi:protein transport protein SEC24